MILIKDNHVDYAGGITNAIQQARNLEELQQVLAIGKVDRIMLDNFELPLLKEAVDLIGGRFLTEASGGIVEENVADYAACGVDYISMGALTHSVKSLDLSLKAF
jgi:nicotinate-nucleotide pyrophosphorylase (carboxylating)